ncbi:MAG: SDR family NAD(P)-dependent oxidoreductase [Pseudomonas sp.]
MVEQFGGLDVLVNNAGFGNINSVEDTSLEEFRREMKTNLFGTIIVTKAAIPVLRRQRSGHIIQLSSVGGRIGAPGHAPIRRRSGAWRAFPKCWRARWHRSACG